MTAQPPSTLRTEALLAAAALLAGAAVGVLVQAAAEVSRARRADREQLQAAAGVLDSRDVELRELQGALDSATSYANGLVERMAELATKHQADRDELHAYRRAGAGVEPAIPPRGDDEIGPEEPGPGEIGPD